MRKVTKSRLQKLNLGIQSVTTEGKPNLNFDLPETATDEDVSFTDAVEDVITDENGNQFTADEMLVVQNPDTLEISLFIPEDEEDTVPEDVTVIGEVKSSDDSILNSSRRKIKSVTRRKYQF